jgi:1-deoxy-D-xylulose-5-phosphate reductoisomerase
MPTRRVILLGSTGSIGRQTIDAIAGLNNLAAQDRSATRYEVVALAAGRDHDALLAQAAAMNIRDVALAESIDLAATAKQRGVNLRTGPDAAERLVREIDADIVLAAIVGSAGLGATLAAVELGRDVALANKEALVAAGSLVTAAANRTGAAILPVDSEHSAIWQCLAGHAAAGATPIRPPCTLDSQVSRIVLTASGGALRSRTKDATYNATPEDALKHPTWSMGAKVTIDSASLTNKALEIIEAHWLFGLPASRIGAIIHPQSIVHSFVEFADGSVIAQLGSPDMRTPIQYALTFPHHLPGRAALIDFATLSRLDFSPPDLERFPALALGWRVIEEGGTSGAVFNAANEAAVEAFLARRIPFGRVAELATEAMDEIGVSPVRDLADITAADAQARAFVRSRLAEPVAR